MRKRLITFLLVGFVLLVVYDLVFQERPRKLQIDGSPLSGAQLDAKLQVKGAKYDLQSHSVKGIFNLYVRAVDDRNIDSVAFSPADTGSREWLAVISRKGKLEEASQRLGDCQLQLSEELEKGKPVSSATFECKEMVMSNDSGAQEIWYPFDSYQVVMAPQACINSLDGTCGKSSKAQLAPISSFSVVIADSSLIGEVNRDLAKTDSYVLTLKRRFFVRMVSLIFLGVSVVFLIYLGVAGDPKDLVPKSLGFFGTLWALRALIVPSAVTIFPTAVDFSILIIFCVLFLVVWRRF